MASVVRKIAGTDPRTNVVGQAHPDMHSVVYRGYPGIDTDFSMRLTSLPFELQDLNATYTRNSVKNVVQNGALVSLSANQFGTSYDAVTGMYGYVPEPAATNLATYSDGNASTYTVSNVVDGTAVPGFTNGLAFGNNSVQRSATKAISVTSGTAYSISFFVIMDDGNAPVVGTANNTGDFSITLNGVIATTKLERLIGSNVYRVSASITASATASHAAGITKYTGQSARTFRVTGIQVETGLRATSYIATTGSTASRAADVLSVPLWVNNLNDSNDGSTANWNRGNCTVSTVGDAQLVTVTASSATNFYNASTKACAGVVTYQIKVKQGNRATCNLLLRNHTTGTNFTSGVLTYATGVITGAGWSAEALTDGWWLCKYTQSTGITIGDTLWGYAHFNGAVFTAGDTGYFKEAQIEPGSTATAYRPTTSTLESAANANIPGFSSAGYTLMGDCRNDVVLGANGFVVVVDDDSNNNRAVIYRNSASNIGTLTTSGGASQASVTETAIGLTRQRIAYSCAANSFLRAVNGAAGTQDVSGIMPAALTQTQIGLAFGGGQFNGYIFRAQLITQALTQAQINGLTQ